MAITVQLRANLLQSSELNSSVTTFDLGSDLEKTSIPNKTVIITTINATWAEENNVLDLYMDQGSFSRCQHIHHTAIFC